MWKVIIFEDGKERELDDRFLSKEEAEMWAETIGFEAFKVSTE